MKAKFFPIYLLLFFISTHFLYFSPFHPSSLPFFILFYLPSIPTFSFFNNPSHIPTYYPGTYSATEVLNVKREKVKETVAMNMMIDDFQKVFWEFFTEMF